jgi:hypothetical protein
MINSTIFALVLLIAAVVIVFIIRRPQHEPFSSSGIDSYDALTHDQYVKLSMKKYNPLADQYDVTRPNFARTDDPAKLDQVTNEIKSAMSTAEIHPLPETGSRFGIQPGELNISLPPPNEILAQARKCEAIKDRSCSALTNPDNKACGICIKGGTAFSQPDKAGKYIGGLLILPEDRLEAEANASGKEPTYIPTVGECAPGYFFVSAEKCEKAKNRLECEEAGVAGGFDGKMKDIARSKCAQVVNGEGNVYVYEPRGRRFNVNLRVLTPTGSGSVGVIVYDGATNKIIGQDSKEQSGVEFVVPVRNVSEGQDIKIHVFEQFSHRPRGRNEVFLVKRGSAQAGYNETKESSEKFCESISARLATRSEVEQSQRKGAQVCACGQTSDGVIYPMNSTEPIPGCGIANGINQCSGKGYSWCYGIKPPSSISSVSSGSYFSQIFAFFSGSKPGQTIWSEYGDDYQAPAYRGVLMQWESEDGKRIVSFEPSIIRLNGVAPSSTSSDGTKTFGNMRRLGTFSKSSMILSPRPRSTDTMLRNQFWIWSNQPNNVSVSFDAQVPGIFMDPFYPEDAALAPRNPLISKPETMKLMRTSPCLRDGEEPGKYSIECLNTLFRSAGGDPLRGKLATEGGGLTQLLSIGDMDAISEHLANLYTIATKGRDVSGNRVDLAKINDAAQKLFGFDLTTPCESIAEDASGNLVIRPKSSPYSSDCLDFLWMNTGNERERGNEDMTRNTAIKNTYTTLYDRYSGLRSKEGSADKRKQYPFQACQRSGSKAPISIDGKPNNAAIMEANSKGSIEKIQNWYNEIHLRANYTNPSEVNNTLHKSYMDQCYGIRRIDYTPRVKECDAVSARYVRVLATAIYGSNNPKSSCIQIPQIQVFDAKDNEIARGKPTSAHSSGYGTTPNKAVDGTARPRSHLEGQYHDDCTTPDKQFWMVDLGSMVRISRVVYYPRTDCCDARQNAAPVQLLNEHKQIVAQQWIGQSAPTNQPQTLAFSDSLTKPIYPISALKDGIRFSLQSATSYDRYLRHAGFAFWAGTTGGRSPQSMDTLFRNDSSFILRNAKNGKSGMFSIEAVNFPGYFLRHAGFRCWLHVITSNLDREDASFTIVNALNGDPSMISLRSSNFPYYYLSTKRENSGEIWITTVDTSNVWDVQRASWKLIPAIV